MFIFPFTALLVIGPLASLTLFATYFKGFVFVFVFAIIGLNSCVIKYFYFRQKC